MHGVLAHKRAFSFSCEFSQRKHKISITSSSPTTSILIERQSSLVTCSQRRKADEKATRNDSRMKNQATKHASNKQANDMDQRIGRIYIYNTQV
jgi:sortase (surface protein transpeptidase)